MEYVANKTIPRKGLGGQVENVHLRIPSVIVKGD